MNSPSGGGAVRIVQRVPTVAEYSALVMALGGIYRQPAAVEVALSRSVFAVCAQVGSRVVGCGRIVGDGAVHLFITDLMVRPEFQRQGIGTKIVATLARSVESLPYPNVDMTVVPGAAPIEMFERHGFGEANLSSALVQRVNPRR